MGFGKRGWRCWKWMRLLCALALLPVVLLGLNFALRKRWIEPLPGVRVEPTRPVMRRSDFDPESPYMRLVNLLLDMAEAVDGASANRELYAIAGRVPPPPVAPPDPEEIFGEPYPPPDECLRFRHAPTEQTWWWNVYWLGNQNRSAEMALEKIRHHPWPSMVPTHAPVPEPVYALPSVTLDSEDPFPPNSDALGYSRLYRARDMLVGGEAFDERDRFRAMWEDPDGWMGMSLSGKHVLLGVQEEGMPGKPLLDAHTDKPIYRVPYAAFAKNAPWTLEQYRDVRRILELYEPFFLRLDSILADPAARMPILFHHEYNPEQLSIRALFRWLPVAAQVKVGSGDWDGAFLCIERTLQLGAMLRRGGDSSDHFVAHQGVRMAMESVWHIASRYPVPVPFLRQVARDIMAHADAAEPHVEALRTGWLVAKSSVPKIYRDSSLHLFDKKRLRVSYLLPGQRMPSRETRLAFVVLTPLMGSTPETSIRNLHACYQHVVALAEQPYSTRTKAEYDNWRARLTPASETSIFLGAHLTPASETSILLGSRDPVGRVIAGMGYFGEYIHLSHARRTVHDAQLYGMALFLASGPTNWSMGECPRRSTRWFPTISRAFPRIPSTVSPSAIFPARSPACPPMPGQCTASVRTSRTTAARATTCIAQAMRLII